MLSSIVMNSGLSIYVFAGNGVTQFGYFEISQQDLPLKRQLNQKKGMSYGIQLLSITLLPFAV